MGLTPLATAIGETILIGTSAQTQMGQGLLFLTRSLAMEEKQETAAGLRKSDDRPPVGIGVRGHPPIAPAILDFRSVLGFLSVSKVFRGPKR